MIKKYINEIDKLENLFYFEKKDIIPYKISSEVTPNKISSELIPYKISSEVTSYSLNNQSKEEYTILKQIYKYMIDIDKEVKNSCNLNELDPEIKEYIKQYYAESDNFNSKVRNELIKMNPGEYFSLEDGGAIEDGKYILSQTMYLLKSGFSLAKYFIKLNNNSIFLWAFLQKLLIITAFLTLIIYNPLYFREIFIWCVQTLFNLLYNTLLMICKYIFPSIWNYIISPILSSLLISLKAFIFSLFSESPVLGIGTGTFIIFKLIDSLKKIYNYILGNKDGGHKYKRVSSKSKTRMRRKSRKSKSKTRMRRKSRKSKRISRMRRKSRKSKRV